MNPRDFALILLDKKHLPGWKANLVRKRNQPGPADPRDWALAERIVSGVVKNLLRLQHEVGHYSGKSLTSIEPLVQKILVIALYQLKLMDRIPPSAAVDQAVEQTKTFGHRRAAGFVNAVLRNVARQPAPTEPDANADPQAYAQQILSHPSELFRRLATLLGNEKALAFCRHDNAEPPMILRLFQGADIAALLAEWQHVRDQSKEKKLGELPPVELTPHELPGLLVVRGARGPILAHWAKKGLAQVQDPTSAGVVARMQISPGQRALDRCAGLGTKTMQIHERAGTAGEIVAVDSSEFRCAELRRLLSERNVTNIKVVQSARLSAIAQQIPELFDRILIDVPCSNSGVLARRPEARYHSAVDCLVKIQRDILNDTLPWLAPGGLLLYSTCSVWPEENELQVNDFLSKNLGLELVEQLSAFPSFDETLPEKYHDGGYLALIRKQTPA